MPKVKNLAISGGGISGVGILGILKYCNECNILDDVENYIGTSVGSIISLLLIIEYTYDEIFEFIKNFDLEKLINNVDIDNFLEHYGFENSNKIIYVIKRLIENKNLSEEITFIELFNKYKKGLTVTGVCLNESKLYYFNHDLFPDMKVLTAIRISCNIPIVFAPIKHDNKLWLDGGIIQNYPITYYKHDIENTLGISIYDKCLEDLEINNVVEFILNLGKCIAYGSNNLDINNFDSNTLKYTFNFSSFADFAINSEKLKEMFHSGYECAKNQHNIIDKFINDEINANIIYEDINDNDSSTSNSIYTTVMYEGDIETDSSIEELFIDTSESKIKDESDDSNSSVVIEAFFSKKSN